MCLSAIEEEISGSEYEEKLILTFEQPLKYVFH